MCPRRKRMRPIDEENVYHFETGMVSPIWEAYSPHIERIFDEPIVNRSTGVNEQSECLYRYGEESGDWSWYVTKRKKGSNGSKYDKIEDELYEKLFNSSGSALVLLHGHIGSGKSTTINYFFRYYLQYVRNHPRRRLEKLVPLRISLKYDNVSTLESDWDRRVIEFLYNRFEELCTREFWSNLGTYILTPAHIKLKKNDKGVLVPEIPERNTEYMNDVLSRVASTLDKIDRASVIKWLRDEVTIEFESTLGEYMNSAIIRLLANYYDYEFVFIVDNIDQLSSSIQRRICRLVDKKMNTYYSEKNIQFIIAVRENFLEPIRRHTFLISYLAHECILPLARIEFKDVLDRRMKVFFPSELRKGPGTITLRKIQTSVKLTNPEIFLNRVFNQFNRSVHLIDLKQLANNNNRAMLDIVRAVLKSPHLTRDNEATLVKHGSDPDRVLDFAALARYISRNRLIDALVRGTNYLISSNHATHIPNVYYSGDGNHYSSTLTRIYILIMVSIKNSIPYMLLETQLKALGHERDCIIRATEQMLEDHLVFSNRGYRIEEKPYIDLQRIEKKDLPYGEFLLDEIAPTLRYMQAMAYVTPMEEKFWECVVIPEEVGGYVERFADRLEAAASLYRQIQSDVEKQEAFISASNEAPRLKMMYQYYGFGDIPVNIRNRLVKEINDIRLINSELVGDINVDEILPKSD